jgi:hypothetical protein
MKIRAFSPPCATLQPEYGSRDVTVSRLPIKGGRYLRVCVDCGAIQHNAKMLAERPHGYTYDSCYLFLLIAESG